MRDTISGYYIDGTIYQSTTSLVYRGRRKTDGLPVVLKTLAKMYPMPEEIARFKQEYKILQTLNLPGIIKAYTLEKNQHRWVMVLEDFEGESLSHLIRFSTVNHQRVLALRQGDLATILRLAIKITAILGQVHQKNIIHKDVNLANIIYNPETDELKLIDFGISAFVTTARKTGFQPTKILEGTPTYMSPEQTGRMNRVVDYRSDFYGLGVTLYELLVGQTPFVSTDVLELVHAHIAKQPVAPSEYDSNIPWSVSEVILKLMAKNAEDRYQSAQGILADLQTCLKQWENQGYIQSFSLGQEDASDKFKLSQKLYGRATQLDLLLSAFQRVCRGVSETALVSGYTGAGKSALIQEFYKAIISSQIYFVSAQLDPFQRNVPYASLIQAFQSLIQQLLTESEEKLLVWREKLLRALGTNGQVIVEVIPDIVSIIGPQPAIPDLAPTEAQNRFNLVFQNFIKIFTAPEHPLIIFLDDLQWADTASLKLLQRLVDNLNSRYLFSIGAYRDNEVDEKHPLFLLVDEVKRNNGVLTEIKLNPLGVNDVTQLIADSFKCSVEQAAPLAELVFAKTRGNPFFLTEFLKSLHTNNLIKFETGFDENNNDPTLKIIKGWQWNLAEIQAHQMTDNVIDLMVDKIEQLAPETQEVLKLAACIGGQFDLQILAQVYQKTILQTSTDLRPAVVEGLIQPLDDSYKLIELDVPGLTDSLTILYMFGHERIQQAIYSLIPEDVSQTIHWQIGQLLLNDGTLEQHKQKIFDVVNHLNLASDLAKTQPERDNLAALNLEAGRRAKTSAAYELAFDYFQTGLRLIARIPLDTTDEADLCQAEANSWEANYALTLALHVEAAEAAYLNAAFETMECLVENILTYAHTLLEKVEAYKIKIQAYKAKNKLLEALNTGLPLLKLLNADLPEKPTKADIKIALRETQTALAGQQIESLINLPEMTDLYALAAMRTLSTMGPAAYFALPELFPLIVCKEVSLSIKYGNAPVSAVGYAAYATFLCGGEQEIEVGYQFGQLALQLLEQIDAREFKARVIQSVNVNVIHWKQHLRETLPLFLNAYASGLETGELEFAAYALAAYCFHSYFAGYDLIELEQQMAKYQQAIIKLEQRIPLHWNQLYRQVVLNLLNTTPSPGLLVGTSYNEETMQAYHLQANDYTTLFFLYLNKLILDYLFLNYEDGLENATQAEKYLDGVRGSFTVPLFYFYDALVRLKLYPTLTKKEKQIYLDKVVANRKKVEKWAFHAPMNHRHKFYLIEAEYHRVLGKEGDAREYYDQAISLARQYSFWNEEALANELAAQFYLNRQQERIAYHYLGDAYYAYRHWGALTKVEALELQYPNLVGLAQIPIEARLITSTIIPHQTSGSLDIASVLKASQAISSEIDLDKLLVKLMKIVIQNAGAQWGCLALLQQHQLLIEAEGWIDRHEIRVLQSIPINAEEYMARLSIEIVNYVCRTKDFIVLDNGTENEKFARTRYILEQKPKSILCVPLVNQGQLLGIIYLENNLTIGAFTPDRVEIMRVLGTQAAIAITNVQAIKVRTEQERLRLQNEFLEKEAHELAKLNADKDKFFSILSHDLRSPFNSLLGSTQIMRDSVATLSRDEVQEMAELIHHSAKAAYDLLENLLYWSRIQRGRMKYDPERLKVFALVQDTINLLKQTAAHKYIELENKVNPNLHVYADGNMTATIIRNLISNALKFTPQGGSVTVSTHPHHLIRQQYSQEEIEFVEVWVTDTGVGISQENIDKLFKLDIHHTTPGTNNEHGSGLGLIICQEMIQQNGGSIWVESELGRGTTIKLTLPLGETTPLSDFLEKYQDEQSTGINTDVLTISETEIDKSLTLPLPEMAELLNLAWMGDMRGVENWTQRIDDLDQRYIDFTRQVRQLARRFEDQQILDLVQQYISSNE